MNDFVEMRNVSKNYRGAYAVKDITLNLKKGEVHGLLGENGAGKSTLTKMLAGAVVPTDGEIWIDGESVSFNNPLEALNKGVAMVYQETSLIPSMSVAQNLYLGEEKLFNRLRGLYIAAQQFLQNLSFNVEPSRLVSELGAAQKQMVEIARAVHHNASVIIFDEPTATLTPEEKRYFFNLVKVLKDRGVTVVFISHALEEALEISDRITIMRDGGLVFTEETKNLDRNKIVQAMVGKSISEQEYGRAARKPRQPGKLVLNVQNLSMGTIVKNNSFSLFSGQVTGMFGLVGAGRSETAKVIAGVIKRDYLHGGEVKLNGNYVRYRTPAPAIRDGISYVTEDRKLEGFFETMSIADNIYSGAITTSDRHAVLYDTDKRDKLSKEWSDKLNIRAISDKVKVIELSGGNQQKVVIAKSLVQVPQVVIFDEPTRGVDVGAIDEIHALINNLADQGVAVMVISSYLPEVLKLSDRILVMRKGRVVEEFSPDVATPEKIMYAAVH